MLSMSARKFKNLRVTLMPRRHGDRGWRFALAFGLLKLDLTFENGLF
jgi:hypothetical protein